MTETIRAKVSESTLRESTGRGWDEWFAFLDAWGGAGRTHTELAERLGEEVGSWWSQTIAVAYEQERGMRAPGQSPDGTFSAGGSKTVAVPVERLYEAFVSQTWLSGHFVIRTATAPKSLRADWEDGTSRLAVGFVDKGEAKAMVGVVHEKLPDAESAARMKAFWREQLAALAASLSA